MSKYDKLTEHLMQMHTQEWRTSFDEIEQILAFPLPSSAYQYQAWWANQSGGGHAQSASWQDAGWKTENLDLTNRTVTFARRYTNTLAGSMNALAETSRSPQNALAAAMRGLEETPRSPLNALAASMGELAETPSSTHNAFNALTGKSVAAASGNALISTKTDNRPSLPEVDFRLTIAQAKAGLAATFGVPIECIEITIKA